MLDTTRPYTFDRIVRIAITAGLIYGIIKTLGYLADVLTPFAVAVLLAYMINPLVERIQKKISNRIAAVVLALLLVAVVVAAATALILPLVISEIKQMGLLLRELVTTSEWTQRAAAFLPARLWETITEWAARQEIQSFFMTDNFWKVASAVVQKVLPGTWGIITGTANVFLGIVGMVVIGLYLFFVLIDYQLISKGWKDLLPPMYKEWVVGFVTDFDAGMSRYFRAQATVASLTGVVLAIGFVLIGLPMGLIFGMFVGLLNMVPYLQLIALPPALLLSLVRALETGGSFWMMLGLTGTVFVVAQMVQDMILVPRIMGKVTGLSPAVMMISLSIWGKLLGLLGLIIALPMTCLVLAYYKRLFIASSIHTDEVNE